VIDPDRLIARQMRISGQDRSQLLGLIAKKDKTPEASTSD
jgi:hypothetical protein